MQPFDPYHLWLGIPPNLHPLNLYQLLGLQTFETDINVIVNAADQRMAHVKSFANGPYGPQSQQLLNELSQAKVYLIEPQLRATYDAQLREAMTQATVVPYHAPLPDPAPLNPAPLNPAPMAAPPATPMATPLGNVPPPTTHAQPVIAPPASPISPPASPPAASPPAAQPPD